MNSLKTYKIILSLSVLPAIAGINNTTAQELSTYLEQAVANNPEIKAYELRYNLAQEKSAEVNTFPDTEFAAGYFVSTPETRTGAQRARFSVKQMLPWFGTVDARIAAQIPQPVRQARIGQCQLPLRRLPSTPALSLRVVAPNRCKGRNRSQHSPKTHILHAFNVVVAVIGHRIRYSAPSERHDQISHRVLKGTPGHEPEIVFELV